jgi:hypothetical protein
MRHFLLGFAAANSERINRVLLSWDFWDAIRIEAGEGPANEMEVPNLWDFCSSAFLHWLGFALV